MTRTTGVIALTLLVTVLGCDKQPVAPSVPGSAAASPAPPQTTPLNTPFAFTTSRNNTEVIYVVDREGGEERRLTTGRAPDLSRDGRIAYESVGGGKREGIFVINDDGTGERFVGEGWDPSWSPDGHYVAVTRYRQGIYVLDVDGASEPRVAARPPAGYEFVLNTAWSPDGGEIAFSACNETSDKWDVYNVCGPLYVVAPDGSSPAVALSMPGNAQSPAWSPDGRRLAFWSEGSIFVHTLGGQTTLAAAGGREHPSWTNDGRLVYDGSWHGSAGARIILSDNGTERLLIPEQPNGAQYYHDMYVTVRK